MLFTRSLALLAAMQYAVSAETLYLDYSVDPNEKATFTHSTSLESDTLYWGWTNTFNTSYTSLTTVGTYIFFYEGTNPDTYAQNIYRHNLDCTDLNTATGVYGTVNARWTYTSGGNALPSSDSSCSRSGASSPYNATMSSKRKAGADGDMASITGRDLTIRISWWLGQGNELPGRDSTNSYNFPLKIDAGAYLKVGTALLAATSAAIF